LARARPLAETLWELETATPADTPERRAALEARLEARARQIADRAVQEQYRRFFRDRLFQLGRPRLDDRRWKDFRRPSTAVRPPVLERPPRIDPALLRRRKDEVRLALLLNHPFLLAEHVETVARHPTGDRELDILLAEILRIYAANPDLDSETLKFHLTENGLGTVVNRVLSPQLAIHAPWAGTHADPETVREAWAELASQIERIGVSGDIAAATQELSADMSEETWLRVHPIYERKQQG
jgi:DNA primase